MCNGFGLIVSKTLEVYFSEPDGEGDCSHSEILSRLGWKDNDDQFIRQFVRVQFPNWEKSSFEFDEDCTLPAWVEENRQEIIDKCASVLERCTPAWAEYKKVYDAARAECKKVYDAAWAECKKVYDAAWAEYEKVRTPAWAEYEKVRTPAWAECEKVYDAAWAECEKVRNAAWAECEKVYDAAWAEYKKVRNAAWAECEKVRNAALEEMINKLFSIPGYVRGK